MTRCALPVLALAFALLVGCSGSSAPRITAGGATFVDPLMQKWAGEYRKAKNVEIDYIAKGSGYGISNVTSKNVGFGCSDAPMKASELEKAKEAGGDVIHIPVTIGAVAIVYNLPGISDLKLNGKVLADIYRGEITTWNHAAIQALNPGASLPGDAIVVVRRAESSGTTNIFTEYLSKNSPEFKQQIGISKSPKWPEGTLGKEGNDGVAGHVKEAAGTIGYVELAYAKKNDIPYATLINKAGQPVKPEPAAVTAAVEAAMKEEKTEEPYTLHPLAYSFTDTAGDAAYPIVGASYAMLFQKQPKDTGPVIVEFLKWAVSDGQEFATELDYAPLPDELRTKAKELLDTVTFE